LTLSVVAWGKKAWGKMGRSSLAGDERCAMLSNAATSTHLPGQDRRVPSQQLQPQSGGSECSVGRSQRNGCRPVRGFAARCQNVPVALATGTELTSLCD
jgi:hypothetical protein